ncbi:MAG TPA: heavy metal-associated domain-containing protein [Acetobacteraceae bacterium]|nr:heavy metal-associated domain-containing protein [Acetobacteraceae bacterium]
MSNATPERVLAVTGMTCQGCVNAVTRVLSRVQGAQEVQVDLAAGRAVVHGNAEPDALLAAVRKAGYGADLASAG